MDEFMEMSPLGIMYVSAALKQKNHQTAIVGTRLQEILKVCREFKPDVIGFSVTTGFHEQMIALSRQIKGKTGGTLFSLFGGPHATYFPEIIEQDGVDAVIVGEAEGAVVEFADAYEKGKDLSKIANLHVKINGTIYRNDVRPLIEDLDSLPFPDRDLVTAYRTTPNRFQTFLASRGCPYECSYCFNESYRRLYKHKGKVVRRRSVDNVIEEIRTVKAKIPLEHVSFQDDEFCSSLDWVREFSDKYKKTIAVPFSCNLRPNLVTEDIVRLLKEGGCVSITMAFEAGNDHVRNTILKRRLSKEQMLNAARIINAHAIFLNIQNILGIPGGSLEADLETLRLNMEARPRYAWVSLCHPYPNTKLGEYACEHGYCKKELLAVKPTFHYRSPLPLKNKLQVENLHKLFAITARYPKTYPLMRALIKLPCTPLYNILRKFFKGWVYYKENRFSVRFSWKEKLRYGIKFITEIGG
jgi:radical SAM superfamily enzyme YgiQ (UPF0313 family)